MFVFGVSNKFWVDMIIVCFPKDQLHLELSNSTCGSESNKDAMLMLAIATSLLRI